MTLGLERGTVALVDHEREWEDEAARTIGVLRRILGDSAVDIRHVGSTSIPTIKAKPIIDIAVGVRDLDEVLQYENDLLTAAFHYRPHDDLADQLLFAAGSFYDGTGRMQTHFIHVVEYGGRQWRDYNNFRELLIRFPHIAKEYEAVKLALAEECGVDAGRKRYLAGKHPFITRTLVTAEAFSHVGRTAHITVDRPAHSAHPAHPDMIYPVNYGFVPGTLAPDGEPIDAYLLGVSEPIAGCDARIAAVIRRKDDAEDKLVAAVGAEPTRDGIITAVDFCERYFDIEILM